MTVMVASRETLPVSARHTYSPESATESCDSRRRDPETWGHDGRVWWHQLAIHGHHPPPYIGAPTYLVLGREGPTTLVPGDGGLSLASHHAVQVQSLSLGDGGC